MINKIHISINGNEWIAECKLGEYGKSVIKGYGDMSILKINEILIKDSDNVIQLGELK